MIQATLERKTVDDVFQSLKPVNKKALDKWSQWKAVPVDDALMKKIQIKRLDEGWFQRPLNDRRISDIIAYAEDGNFLPPILIADINGQHVLVDGQHRLEARKKYNYPLFAIIVKMSKAEATQSFVDINSRARRVPRKHILLVDTGEFSKSARELAAKYQTSVMNVWSLMQGITGDQTSDTARRANQDDFTIADKILEEWSDDPMWGVTGEIYNRPGVLKMVGRILERSHSDTKILAKLKKLDYSRSGPFWRIYGSSSSNCAAMVDVCRRYCDFTLLKRGSIVALESGRGGGGGGVNEK